MGERDTTWRPWRALRDRREIEFELADLPPGLRALWCRDPMTGARAILISRSLSQTERLAALAHELVHDERDGSGHRPDMPPRLQVAVAREEERTDRIVADRLIPQRKLAAWVDAELGLGHQVTAEGAADRFEVPLWVASLALAELHRRIA